jgi:hypothetical protein
MFIAVDKLNNQTRPRMLEKILKSTIIASPKGGIYNHPVSITLESSKGKSISWKAVRNNISLKGEAFQPYTSPITFQYPGVYNLSYRTGGPKGEGTIQEQMYIIDNTPPQVIPFLEKSRIDSSFYLVFETSEPAKIYYTLDGSLPTLDIARTVGSAFQKEEIRIAVKRKGKRILRYFGVDRAENRSSMYELDLFSPHVITYPPPGKYNTILSLTLKSQEGNTIYYSRDSLSLSSKSSVYSKPIIIKETQEIWFFAVDITGFAGPKQKALFDLNLQPEPHFSFSEKNIVAGKHITLDAGLSVDTETPAEKLMFRWDLNGDGEFETEFQPSPAITTKFRRPGLQTVVLEVKDPEGMIGELRKSVHVVKFCPPDMISIAIEKHSFCIERFEWPNNEGSKPLNNVNWAEAAMLCLEKGRRLCSVEEWQTACKGKWNHFFSYGNSFVTGACNTNSNNTVQSKSNSRCISSDGVYDLVGNLWEWVNDYRDGEHVIVGGSHLQEAASSCELSLPSQIGSKSKTVGFRCCQ